MAASNNRGGMRPQGRSPPFLAVGLFVALCILGFNYWSMSSRNAELGNEITLLESEVRVLSAKKVSAEKRSESVFDKVKDLEILLKKERNNFGNKEAELAECNKNLDQKREELTEVMEEVESCRSISSACEEDKKSLQAEIEKLKVELANQASAAQQAASACSESGCKQYVDQLRMKILDILMKNYGPEIIKTLHANRIDVGKYINIVAEPNQPQVPNIPKPNDIIMHGQQDDVKSGNTPAPRQVFPNDFEMQKGFGNQPGADRQPVANSVDTNQSNPNMNQRNRNQESESQLKFGNKQGLMILPSDKSVNKTLSFKTEQAPDVGKDALYARIENKVVNVQPSAGGQNKTDILKGSLDKTGGNKDVNKDVENEEEDKEAQMKLKFEPAGDIKTLEDGIDKLNRKMKLEDQIDPDQ